MKYTPSVKNNNAIKNELVTDMKAFLYRIEKGKFSAGLDKEVVKDVYDSLKVALEDIENVIFTGEEDLSKVNEKRV